MGISRLRTLLSPMPTISTSTIINYLTAEVELDVDTSLPLLTLPSHIQDRRLLRKKQSVP